jgi:hypothetical protein
MPKNKSNKTKKPKNTKKTRNVRNLNSNKININIGTKGRATTTTTATRGGNKMVQPTSTPYPVYNQARQVGGAPVTVINTPQPILQPQNNFTQQDLTNIKDEIIKTNQQLLTHDPNFQNVRQDIQDMKDSHRQQQEQRQQEKEAKRIQQEYEKETRRREKELQRQRDIEDQQLFKEYVFDNNDKFTKGLLALDNNVKNTYLNLNEQNKNVIGHLQNFNNDFLYGMNQIADTVSKHQMLLPPNPAIDNVIIAENAQPELQSNKSDEKNAQPELQSNKSDALQPDNRHLLKVARNIFEVKPSELDPNEHLINIRPEGIADIANKEQIKKIAKDATKVHTNRSLEEKITEYIELYNLLHNGEDPPENVIDSFKKPMGTARLEKAMIAIKNVLEPPKDNKEKVTKSKKNKKENVLEPPKSPPFLVGKPKT